LSHSLFVISDVHLSSENDERAQKLISFLESSPKAGDAVVLLGDIFDLWIGAHTYFVLRYASVVEALRSAKDRGVSFHYFEGNHDLHLGRFWSGEMGFTVYESGHLFEVGPKKIWLEHGDLTVPNDRGYRFLRWFLRTAPLKWLSYNVPGTLIQKIGGKSSQVSRNYTTQKVVNGDDRVRSFMREYARKKIKETGADLVCIGHTHTFDDFHFDGTGKESSHFINLGSWEREQIVLKVSSESEEFIHL
jgi:UDP-2,3-diacylglucosamine hydrolase